MQAQLESETYRAWLTVAIQPCHVQRGRTRLHHGGSGRTTRSRHQRVAATNRGRQRARLPL